MQSSRILKALTFTLTLVAASNSFAGAIDLLNQDLQAGIKSLPRETRMYTYFNTSSSTNSASKRDSIATGLLGGGKAFWDLNNNSTHLSNAGLGVYLAVDPFVSSPANGADVGMPGGFGSSMLEVTFNPGTRYLDLVKAIRLSPATIQAIRTETGMTEYDAQRLFNAEEKGFWRDTVRYMAEKQNEAFRKIVLEVYRRNSIVLTEYRWYSGVSGLCSVTSGKEQKMFSALVFVGTNLNSIKSKTLVYSSNASNLSAQESEAVARNNKLLSVLAPIHTLEKKYQSAGSSQKQALLGQMKAEVNSKYTNQAELNDIRSKTLDCVK